MTASVPLSQQVIAWQPLGKALGAGTAIDPRAQGVPRVEPAGERVGVQPGLEEGLSA
jgi:hypothetical protein